MVSAFIRQLLLLLPLSFHANCAPQHKALENRAIRGYQETLKGQGVTLPLDGITWKNFGLATNDPKYDTYAIQSTGLSAGFAAVDNENGIYIFDELSRTEEDSPNDYFHSIIQHFITSGNRAGLRYLAIPNIVEESTRQVLESFLSDGSYRPGDKNYDRILEPKLAGLA